MFDLDFQLKQMHLFFFSQEKWERKKRPVMTPHVISTSAFLQLIVSRLDSSGKPD